MLDSPNNELLKFLLFKTLFKNIAYKKSFSENIIVP